MQLRFDISLGFSVQRTEVFLLNLNTGFCECPLQKFNVQNSTFKAIFTVSLTNKKKIETND